MIYPKGDHVCIHESRGKINGISNGTHEGPSEWSHGYDLYIPQRHSDIDPFRFLDMIKVSLPLIRHPIPYIDDGLGG